MNLIPRIHKVNIPEDEVKKQLSTKIKKNMNKSPISFVMPQADIDAVKSAIKIIESKMPFLISLSNDERAKMMKLGPKSVDFAQEAYNASVNFPGILPPAFDKVEYVKDTNLFKVLGEFKLLLNSLNEKVDSTYMAVGRESMDASLHIYELVQASSKRIPGLQSVELKLKERFKKQGRKRNKKQNPDTDPQA
jgi:hypothetical protein